jgi:hypothetical protein
MRCGTQALLAKTIPKRTKLIFIKRRTQNRSALDQDSAMANFAIAALGSHTLGLLNVSLLAIRKVNWRINSIVSVLKGLVALLRHDYSPIISSII